MLCTNIVLNIKTKKQTSYCGLTDAGMRASEKFVPVFGKIFAMIIHWNAKLLLKFTKPLSMWKILNYEVQTASWGPICFCSQ